MKFFSFAQPNLLINAHQVKKEYREIASTKLRQALRAAADSQGILSVRKFVEIALYHPTAGYYRKPALRVGKHREADFYTSSSLKSAFAQALIEAASTLCQNSGFEPRETTWLEIGAEPDAALLDRFEHPFAEAKCLGLADNLELSGQLVVFSNELFDAQSFDTFVFTDGQWAEEALEIKEDGIRPILISSQVGRSVLAPPPMVAFAEERERSSLPSIIEALPNPAPEGYRIDLPTGSRDLAREIFAQNWQGLFIAFDYGKSWQALTHDLPIGTARAYYRHEQKPDIFANAGEQDITHHICWDWLEEDLKANRFTDIRLESQEAFIIKRASKFLESTFSPNSPDPAGLKSQLRQLIHPSLMGQKFQALTGTRK